MTGQMKCPHCGQSYSMTPEQERQYVGQTIQCTNCKQMFTVGAEGATTPAGAPPLPPPPFGAVGYATPIAPAKTSGLAVAALVIGCVGLFVPLVGLIAIVLGIIALSKTRDPAVGGKGLAIAGISVGGAGLLVSACMLSILLPSLNRARETANRVKCASNMRQIGQALLLYANDNRGAYPPRPDLLLLTQDITPEVFVCPNSNDTPVPSGAVQAALNAPNTVLLKQGSNSYVYCGAGQTTSSSAEAILLYEPLSDHGNDGCNFLYGDGRVLFNTRATAQSIINEVSGGHNPPRADVLRGAR
jgi:hypothetical protein